jgi:hypothetical protein
MQGYTKGANMGLLGAVCLLRLWRWSDNIKVEAECQKQEERASGLVKSSVFWDITPCSPFRFN